MFNGIGEVGSEMNTELNYLYRDASNYKQHETIVFYGKLTPEQKKKLNHI